MWQMRFVAAKIPKIPDRQPKATQQEFTSTGTVHVHEQEKGNLQVAPIKFSRASGFASRLGFMSIDLVYIHEKLCYSPLHFTAAFSMLSYNVRIFYAQYMHARTHEASK